MSRNIASFSMLLLIGTLAFAADYAAAAATSCGSEFLTEAQKALTSWEDLQNITSGIPCRVYMTDGKVVSGILKEWTPDRLILSNPKGKLIECNRLSISQVCTLSRVSRKKRVLWAGLVGFGIGLPVGYAIAPTIGDNDKMAAGERVGAGMAIGALWGGIAAGITAIHRAEHETVVYRTK